MERFEQIRDLILGLEEDFNKFYGKQVQTAGTRIRKGMQELKVLAQEIRLEVQNMKNEKAKAAKKASTGPKKPFPGKKTIAAKKTESAKSSRAAAPAKKAAPKKK